MLDVGCFPFPVQGAKAHKVPSGNSLPKGEGIAFPRLGISTRQWATSSVADGLPLPRGGPGCSAVELRQKGSVAWLLLPLPFRRGPYWPPGFSGRRIHWGLLSPALSSLGGGEGEAAAPRARTSLTQRQWGWGEGEWFFQLNSYGFGFAATASPRALARSSRSWPRPSP